MHWPSLSHREEGCRCLATMAPRHCVQTLISLNWKQTRLVLQGEHIVADTLVYCNSEQAVMARKRRVDTESLRSQHTFPIAYVDFPCCLLDLSFASANLVEAAISKLINDT